MKKKSRISKDAFDWVDGPTDKSKDTKINDTTRSKQEANHKTVKFKSAANTKSKVSKLDDKNPRTIYIAYKKISGDIVATQEFISTNAADINNIPWSGMADDIAAKAFTLADEIAKKELIEIHNNYKVTGTGILKLKSR